MLSNHCIRVKHFINMVMGFFKVLLTLMTELPPYAEALSYITDYMHRSSNQ